MDQYLVFSLPVVDGGAEDTQAGAKDGAEDGPVLGLLCLCALLFMRIAHGVGERAEALALSLLEELVLLHQLTLVLELNRHQV